MKRREAIKAILALTGGAVLSPIPSVRAAAAAEGALTYETLLRFQAQVMAASARQQYLITNIETYELYKDLLEG